jgi:hypothetical protein
MLFNLAQVQSQLGACRDATELYRRFVASDPGPEARSSAERALELLGACADSPEPSLGDGLLPALQIPTPRDALPATMASGMAPVSLLGHEPEAGSVAESAEAGSHAWLWAFAGVSATSAIVGAVFYGQARAAERDLDRFAVAGPAVIETQQRGQTALARARAFGGLAAGFALAAGATYWLSSPASDEREPAPGWGTLSWAPVEGGGVGSYSFEF